MEHPDHVEQKLSDEATGTTPFDIEPLDEDDPRT